MNNKVDDIIEQMEADGIEIDPLHVEQMIKYIETGEKPVNMPNNTEIQKIQIQNMIDNEPDWRKKAAMAARLISLNFE